MSSQSAIDLRRMIRRYTDQPVDAATVQRLLNAAIRAPSPHNRQPWRFAVVRGEARICLARSMGEQLRADSTRDEVPAAVVDRDVARSYQRITGAPVAILACLCMADMDVYPDERRNIAERCMAVQAVAAAIQNILLRATELGLGACWMCAPLFCQEAVIRTLQLPSDWLPQALITVGYPADEGKDRPRHKIEDVSVFIQQCSE